MVVVTAFINMQLTQFLPFKWINVHSHFFQGQRDGVCLGDSGVSAKPKMSRLSIPPSFFSPLGHLFLTGASTSRFCDCWSETIWVQSATSHKPTNQPGSNTSSRYSYFSCHLPFVSLLVFLVAFCGTRQTISNRYSLETLQDFFSLLNQTS